ncbi:MAG: Na/Pi cotransporter family protein [Bacilli bacterium]
MKTEVIEAIITLLSGLGILLVGFKMLSDNIERLANVGLKKLFSKTSKNIPVGIGIGALTTAIIQSSGATTIMIVGFVNAGAMSLLQATAMIMGANIGTTITAQIAALGSFDVALYATLFSIIGMVIYMVCKKEKVKTTGLAIAGLGLVFVALSLMKNSMSEFNKLSEVTSFLSSCSNPFLLLLFGILFTAIVQSSSAVTTILISMAAVGMVIGGGTTGGNAILYIILGSNIGSCSTALISSIGASVNAKRTSLIHLMFNTFGAILFFIFLLFVPNFMDFTFNKWFSGAPQTSIAMFHTFFNIICTLIFAPLSKYFVKLSQLIIKDKKNEQVTTYIDDRFLHTPSIAIDQATKEAFRLGELSMNALKNGFDMLLDRDYERRHKLREDMQNVQSLNEELLAYLVKISSTCKLDTQEHDIAKLHKIINDFYRLIEIADNMIGYTKKVINNDINFSEKVNQELTLCMGMLENQFKNVSNLNDASHYKTKNKLIEQISNCEENIDDLRETMIKEHITRLENNECLPKSSGVFINLISNLERAGDHLFFVSESILDKDTK